MITVERLEHIAREALLGGYGRVHAWRDNSGSRRLVTLAISMDCEAPVYAELHARYSAQHGKAVKPLTVIIEGRCRKCAPCRERRRMFWAARATTEYNESALTLFGTLTFRPEEDVRIDALARIELAKKGVDFDRLPPEEIFRERVRFAGAEVTKWLKRLRDSDRGRKLKPRYLLVAEAHASGRTSELKRGRPHFHCLLHQQAGTPPLVLANEWLVDRSGQMRTDRNGNPLLADTAFLKSQWSAGLSTFALCRSPQAASYVCKYLTKEQTSVRIRCSFQYGTRNEVKSSERSEARENRQPQKAVVPTTGGNISGNL